MTKKQKPTPKPQRKTGAITVAAKRKPKPKPCPSCQYGDHLGTYNKCHICGALVSYTGSNAHDAMPQSIRETYFAPHATLPAEKRGHKLGWGGTWYCAYTAHRVYTLFGVQHTFCVECVYNRAAKQVAKC